MVGSMDPIGNHCVCTLTVALERTGYGHPTFVCVSWYILFGACQSKENHCETSKDERIDF